MHFEDFNWMGIEKYLEKDTRVILVLGACEQHGYLSLLTDVKIPVALAEAASDESGVVIAPTLNFGCSPYFLDFPGTISLRLETYLNVVGDVLRSLYGAGFRQVLILNGHGGNTPVKTYLVELVNELPDLDLRWYAWWTSETVASICEKYDLIGEHASWMEAFDFTVVTDMPEDEKPQVDTKNAILGKAANRTVYGDGMFGGTYQTDPAVMQEMFDACLADILSLVNFD
ncbi:creatininase family protein [bacterium]|nr:creatininase family protein [bacterium]